MKKQVEKRGKKILGVRFFIKGSLAPSSPKKTQTMDRKEILFLSEDKWFELLKSYSVKIFPFQKNDILTYGKTFPWIHRGFYFQIILPLLQANLKLVFEMDEEKQQVSLARPFIFLGYCYFGKYFRRWEKQEESSLFIEACFQHESTFYQSPSSLEVRLDGMPDAKLPGLWVNFKRIEFLISGYHPFFKQLSKREVLDNEEQQILGLETSLHQDLVSKRIFQCYKHGETWHGGKGYTLEEVTEGQWKFNYIFQREQKKRKQGERLDTTIRDWQSEDREFLDSLDEDPLGRPCLFFVNDDTEERCESKRVKFSSLCKKHHFEMITGRRYKV